MRKKKETQEKVVSILEQYIIKAYTDDRTIDVPFVQGADEKEFITHKQIGEDIDLEEDYLVDEPEKSGYEEGELDGEISDEKNPPYEEGELDGEVEDEDEPENYEEIDDDDDDDDDDWDEDLDESLIFEQEKKKDEEDIEDEDIPEGEPQAPEDLAINTADEPSGEGEELPTNTRNVPGAESSPEDTAAAAADEAAEEVAAGGQDPMTMGAQQGMATQPAASDYGGGGVGAPGMDPTMGGMMDPSMGANIPGMDSMTGMSYPPTAEQVGRIFELKKIYSRLLSVEQYLSYTSDDYLLKLKSFVSKAIELFEILVFNLDSFKNKLDEFIVMFYKFVQEIYELLDTYYKKKDKEMEDK
jgi:hypothetical protein